MVMVAVCQKEQKRANSNTPGLFKPLLVSHLLMSHWPKDVTWPSQDSRKGEIDLLEEETVKSVCKLYVSIANAYRDGYNVWPLLNLPQHCPDLSPTGSDERSVVYVFTNTWDC